MAWGRVVPFEPKTDRRHVDMLELTPSMRFFAAFLADALSEFSEVSISEARDLEDGGLATLWKEGAWANRLFRTGVVASLKEKPRQLRQRRYAG